MRTKNKILASVVTAILVFGVASAVWCVEALTRQQQKDIKTIAKMIVRFDSTSRIKIKWENHLAAAFIKYESSTEGAGHQADMASLEALKKETEKEMAKQEKNKDDARKKALRDHVRGLIEMLEEMAKIQRKQYDSTGKILK